MYVHLQPDYIKLLSPGQNPNCAHYLTRKIVFRED